MGSFTKPNGKANAELQSFILSKLKGIERSSVVSTNAIVRDVRAAMPSCPLSTQNLTKLVTETAMLLGLIPVLDRSRLADNDDECGAAYGYGHRAHRADPSATYVFQSEPPRTLPIQTLRVQIMK